MSSATSPFSSATDAKARSISEPGEMQGWKAWYADGSVYSSHSTRWTDLPAFGIIGVVVYYEPPRRNLVYGGDWYYLDEDGEPTCTETHPDWGSWVAAPGVPHDELKQSGAVEDFDEVVDEMMEAREWP